MSVNSGSAFKRPVLLRDPISASQQAMKWHYDEKTVVRSFMPGDRVLFLLPILGNSGMYIDNPMELTLHEFGNLIM